jgi:hypothetical protein
VTAHKVACITLLGCGLSAARREQVAWEERLGNNGDDSPRGANHRPEPASSRRPKPAATTATTTATAAAIIVTIVVAVVSVVSVGFG